VLYGTRKRNLLNKSQEKAQMYAFKSAILDPANIVQQLAQPAPTRADKQKDIENLLSHVLGDSRPTSAGPSTPRHGSRSRPPSGFGFGSRPLSDDRRASTQRLSSEGSEPRDSQTIASGTTYVTTATQTLTIAPLVTVYEQPSDAPPPREVLTYNKAVQTSEDWEPQRQERGVGSDEDEEWTEDGRPKSGRQQEREEEIRERIKKEVEEEMKLALHPTSESIDAKEEDRFPARALTNEELEAVTTSKDFQEFLEQSTKVIERALDEEYDLLTDYAHGKSNLDDDDEGYGTGKGKRGRRVREVAQYWDERQSKKRMISDIAFSPKVSVCTVDCQIHLLNPSIVPRVTPSLIYQEPVSAA
jgi:dynein intermediate chain